MRCSRRRPIRIGANRFNDTPLMLAALNGNLDVVRKLCRRRRAARSAGLDAR